MVSCYPDLKHACATLRTVPDGLEGGRYQVSETILIASATCSAVTVMTVSCDQGTLAHQSAACAGSIRCGDTSSVLNLGRYDRLAADIRAKCDVLRGTTPTSVVPNVTNYRPFTSVSDKTLQVLTLDPSQHITRHLLSHLEHQEMTLSRHGTSYQCA
jgi:hypothetical protein